MRRKEALVNGKIYHIFNKSIADFIILNNDSEFERMLQLIKYYRIENNLKFAEFITLKMVEKNGFNNTVKIISKDKKGLVQIIAYCLMPTHFHLILKQLQNNGISDYMRKILESYSSYFNMKHKRKGPLWESKFYNILVKDDEQLLHLTRYIHLNPVTAKLVDKPKDWEFSSYKEFYSRENNFYRICQFNNILEINPLSYRKFVNDRISYQRELAKIKRLLIGSS